MDISRLNGLGSVFSRRRSRRDTLKFAGMGLGAAAIGSSVLGKAASGQEATPATEVEHLGLPAGERTFTMFVQTAHAGTWEPKAGEEGVYTLTLTGLPAQTVYFSDRPSRVVGTQTTSEFLSALGFDEENAPNAALVTSADDGANDILVIELFNPVYTEGEGPEGATLVYEARILENYHETGLGRVALEQNDQEIPASFEGASLFIDDCADGYVHCVKNGQLMASQSFGCCYHFPSCVRCWDIGGICASVPGCEDNSCSLQNLYDCRIFAQ